MLSYVKTTKTYEKKITIFTNVILCRNNIKYNFKSLNIKIIN